MNAAETDRGMGSIVRRVMQIALPVLVIAGAYGIYGMFVAAKPEPPRRAKSEQVFAVKTAPVKMQTVQPTLTLYGQTSSGRKVDLRALVAGTVVKVGDAFRDGNLVKKGDLLLQIDPFDYRGALTEAKAQLKEAKGRLSELKLSQKSERDLVKRDEAALELAKTDADRARRLIRRGTVSQKTLDDREATLNTRRQTLEQRRNNVKVWAAKIEQQEASIDRLQWSVERAERRLQETTLVAPFDGYIDNANAEIGRTLNANDAVATLIDKNAIDVGFTLTDQQYGRIVAKDGNVTGRKAKVTWRVGEKPLTYDALVDRVDAQINANAGGVQVFARIVDPTDPVPLRPGAFVEVVLPDVTFERVMSLPVTAVYNNNTVYLNMDGRLEPRTVQIVGADGERVLVSGQIAEGENVVTTRLSTPARGVKVEAPGRSRRPGRGRPVAQRGAS